MLTATDIKTEDQLLFRVDQACIVLATSRTSLYRAISSGRLRSIKINGGQRRITRQALLEYIAAQERGEE